MKRRTIESDAVVVGAGIAGAMTAYQLAAKGKRVAVVEKGIRLTPELIQKVFDSESFIGHPDVPQQRIEFYGDAKRARAIPSVVGGMARFYAAVSLRMREQEFNAWPFSYSDIEPYYTRAEQLMQISGNEASHPLRLPPMSDHSQRLFKAAQDLGLKPFQHPMAINFDAGCIRCNHCNQVPCAYLAKWDPDHFLQAHKNLPIDLFYETKVEKIVWAKNGSERRVDFIEAVDSKTGAVLEFRAKQFVLASGAILTPTLLLRAGAQEWNPLVGKNLMTHCLGLVVGFFPFPMSAEQDFNKWFSVADYYFDDAGRVRGLIQQDHLTTRKKVLSKIPKWLQPIVAKFYYNTCQMMVIGEDEPRIENRIDANAVIHHHFTPQDEAKRDFLGKKTKKIMRKAGALLTFFFKGKSIYHACGTCRMGKSLDDSVSDANGLVWGTKNLYVADASTFTTSSGVNPSLTIAANALRIAEKI